MRCHGVLAPNAKLRAPVAPQEPAETEQSTDPPAGAECEIETAQARPGRIRRARLLTRVFDMDMQHGPNCGAGELEIIAAILDHLGSDPQPPAGPVGSLCRALPRAVEIAMLQPGRDHVRI